MLSAYPGERTPTNIMAIHAIAEVLWEIDARHAEYLLDEKPSFHRLLNEKSILDWIREGDLDTPLRAIALYCQKVYA